MKAAATNPKKARIPARQWTLEEGAVWTAASSPSPASADKWSNVLRDNAALPARLRHAVDGQLQPSLRAEIHVEEPRGILDRAMGETAPLPPETPSATLDDLVLLCREAGWEPMVRPKSGLVLVSFDNAPPARLVAEEGGGLRCVVELASGDDASATVREARALLLLRLNAEMRLVRAQRRMEATELEVTFPIMPSPELLGHALSALQTALRTAAAEFGALGDETLAGEFLATMQPPPPGGGPSQTQT